MVPAFRAYFGWCWLVVAAVTTAAAPPIDAYAGRRIVPRTAAAPSWPPRHKHVSAFGLSPMQQQRPRPPALLLPRRRRIPHAKNVRWGRSMLSVPTGDDDGGRCFREGDDVGTATTTTTTTTTGTLQRQRLRHRPPHSLDDALAETSRRLFAHCTGAAAIQTALVRLGVAFYHQQQQQPQPQYYQLPQLAADSRGRADDDGPAAAEEDDADSTGTETGRADCYSYNSTVQRVPGCVATVHVQTTCYVAASAASSSVGGNRISSAGVGQERWEDASSSSLSLSSSSSSWTVGSVRGTADAYLSRGLLACLAMALEGALVRDVLALPGDDATISRRLGLQAALSPGRHNGLASMLRTVQSQLRECCHLHQQEQQRPVENTNVTTAETASDLPAAAVPNVGAPDANRAILPPVATVALLLSGGVDSSVALNLLVRSGGNSSSSNNGQRYNVTAFYLKIWLEDELTHLGECPWEDDYRQCVAVCRQAGNVPLETISLQNEYRRSVIAYTVAEARAGRTPNPDILCNSRIKFGCFYEAIADRNFDFVATGHYAQLVRRHDDTLRGNDAATVRLLRAPDPVKDQSYFLCTLTQEQLRRVLFPIGHLHKSAVRQLAVDFALPNRNRPDSQGLCFLGRVKFDAFLGAYLPDRPGPIVDAATGETLGRHRGLWYHTVGQRRGIGKVLTPTATSRGPWYVVAKHPDTDTVYCSNRYDEEIFAASRSEFGVENIQWMAGLPPPPPPFHAAEATHAVNGSMTTTTVADTTANRVVHQFSMKIRHGPKLVDGLLSLAGPDSSDGNVRLDSKDSGLAPGQYVVFYNQHDDECLGSAVISERQWASFHFSRQPAETMTATTGEQLLLESKQ